MFFFSLFLRYCCYIINYHFTFKKKKANETDLKFTLGFDAMINYYVTDSFFIFQAPRVHLTLSSKLNYFSWKSIKLILISKCNSLLVYIHHRIL